MKPTDPRTAFLKAITSMVTAELFGVTFKLIAQRDVKRPEDGRHFIQWQYHAFDHDSRKHKLFKSRKWYLSDHMLEDEIIKTIYLAYEVCCKHEIMHGFKINGCQLFNPHVNYKELLAVSHKEIKR